MRVSALGPDAEGVIQYRLECTPGPAPAFEGLAALEEGRDLLYRCGLIGQSPDRYQGLGFGNISVRLRPGACPFVITGTQTGHLPRLSPHHYTCVTAFDVARNRLHACGPVQPSSEALTHAALYDAREDIGCVMHGHDPLLWQRGEALGIPGVPASVGYGTPAMAEAVAMLARTLGNPGALVMRGHEDGVLVFGAEVASASRHLETLRAAARRLPPGPDHFPT